MSIILQLSRRLGGDMEVWYIVSDFTGTVSFDGSLLPGVADLLRQLAARGVKIYFLTADTHGKAREALAGLPVEVEIVQTGTEKPGKVEQLGLEHTVVLGNGYNDVPMFKMARLGIVVDAGEGVNGTLLGIAIEKGWPVAKSPLEALGLLLNPKRLFATLRD